jgi:hypothetical protein
MIPNAPHPFVEFQGGTVTIDTLDKTLSAHTDLRVNYINPLGETGFWVGEAVETTKNRTTPPPEELIAGQWRVWSTSTTSSGVPRISHAGIFYVDKVGTVKR